MFAFFFPYYSSLEYKQNQMQSVVTITIYQLKVSKHFEKSSNRQINWKLACLFCVVIFHQFVTNKLIMKLISHRNCIRLFIAKAEPHYSCLSFILSIRCSVSIEFFRCHDNSSTVDDDYDNTFDLDPSNLRD